MSLLGTVLYRADRRKFVAETYEFNGFSATSLLKGTVP